MNPLCPYQLTTYSLSTNYVLIDVMPERDAGAKPVRPWVEMKRELPRYVEQRRSPVHKPVAHRRACY